MDQLVASICPGQAPGMVRLIRLHHGSPEQVVETLTSAEARVLAKSLIQHANLAAGLPPGRTRAARLRSDICVAFECGTTLRQIAADTGLTIGQVSGIVYRQQKKNEASHG